MDTRLIHINKLPEEEQREALMEAGRIIREGGLVAFPTETVYGLGADGLNAGASKRIYAAKGRPSDNPLIIHIAEMAQVDVIAKDISPAARRIMETFWPGPLTVILKKKEIVPDETTGGLDTVAVRMPSHKTARDLIRISERLIAAPSANTSGRPSPTLAEHVYDDMQGRIPMILDGGAVGIGIESTIVDMTGRIPVILRPGFISEDMIKEVAGEAYTDPAMKGKQAPGDIKAKAPGMKYRHYAPKGQMTLVEGPEDKVICWINREAKEKERQGCRVVVLGSEETIKRYTAEHCRCLGSRKEPQTIAAGLYRLLRECDDFQADYIYSESFFASGLGDAIMNRMLKAAGYQLITL